MIEQPPFTSYKYLLAILILLGSSLSLPCLAEEQLEFPFEPGEEFSYSLRWGLVPAGYANIRILPDIEMNGRPARHFQLTARSNDFVDLFYQVRDKIESFTNITLTRSLLYKKDQNEGSTHREVVVNFDSKKNLATYTNFGNAQPPTKVPPGTLDPLSAVFYIRRHLSHVGQVIENPITDGKRVVIGHAKVIRKEIIYIGDKRYETFVVEPDLKDVKGVFEKSDDSRIRLWFTTDPSHLLVKITSKVVVGSFTCELISKSSAPPKNRRNTP